MPGGKTSSGRSITVVSGTTETQSGAVTSGERVYVVLHEVENGREEICGIFSTENLAEGYCEKFGYNELRITVYEVDFRVGRDDNAAA